MNYNKNNITSTEMLIRGILTPLNESAEYIEFANEFDAIMEGEYLFESKFHEHGKVPNHVAEHLGRSYGEQFAKVDSANTGTHGLTHITNHVSKGAKEGTVLVHHPKTGEFLGSYHKVKYDGEGPAKFHHYSKDSDRPTIIGDKQDMHAHLRGILDKHGLKSAKLTTYHGPDSIDKLHNLRYNRDKSTYMDNSHRKSFTAIREKAAVAVATGRPKARNTDELHKLHSKIMDHLDNGDHYMARKTMKSYNDALSDHIFNAEKNAPAHTQYGTPEYQGVRKIEGAIGTRVKGDAQTHHDRLAKMSQKRPSDWNRFDNSKSLKQAKSDLDRHTPKFNVDMDHNGRGTVSIDKSAPSTSLRNTAAAIRDYKRRFRN